METILIKGKEYVQVNERVKEFRNNPKYVGWSLISEVVQLTDNFVVIKASILNAERFVVATGIAQEDRDSSNINKTSYVENCESSAWGRALGCLGIGIDVAICSAEEVKTAIDKQEKLPPMEITLEDAKMRKTTKGKYYYELDDKSLQWIVDSDKASEDSKKCASMVLEDRKQFQDDAIEIKLDEKDLPF